MVVFQWWIKLLYGVSSGNANYFTKLITEKE